jgi:hypothetical protein
MQVCVSSKLNESCRSRFASVHLYITFFEVKAATIRRLYNVDCICVIDDNYKFDAIHEQRQHSLFASFFLKQKMLRNRCGNRILN